MPDGFKTWALGDVLTADDLNGYLMEQAVCVFSTTTARGAAISSPAEGQMAYITTDNELTIYDGSGWVSVGRVIAQVRADDGSSSEPAYSFTDDTDTGFYRAATGQINVTNNNNIGFLFGPSINVTLRNLRGDVDNTRQLGTSAIAFSKTYSHQYVMGTTGPTINFGTGTPEGAVTAPVGSLFLRTNGGAGTTLYVKESGAGNTGWAAK